MSKKEDQLFEKWAQWFKVLDTEIVNLFTQQHIFQETQEMIRNNPAIHQPGDFNFWMAVWYSSSLSIAIRKQSDKNAGSISYINLLQEIHDNPTVISRTRYKNCFVDERYTESDADGDLDRVLGRGESYIDPDDDHPKNTFQCA